VRDQLNQLCVGLDAQLIELADCVHGNLLVLLRPVVGGLKKFGPL
jgi:hypothetical protein